MIAEDLRHFMEAYERAWRSPGTAALAQLFTPEATYSPGPYTPTITGRDAIAGFWEAEREGPDEPFSLSWSPVAIEGRTAVARVEVRYEGPPPHEYRDLWIITLQAGTTTATAFEEWPFWPGQPLVPRPGQGPASG